MYLIIIEAIYSAFKIKINKYIYGRILVENKVDINKIGADVITDLARTMAQSLYNKVKKHIGDVTNKEEIDFGNAYEKYLVYAKKSHEKIKTLLYRHTAKDIYSFYECTYLELNGALIDTSNINNVLNVGKKIIITGTGGIGKSVMMKYFLINAIQNTQYIPILIELRGLNEYKEENVELLDYIYQVMKKLKFELEKNYFEYSLEIGKYIILLDGFDEIKSDISYKVTNQILYLSERFPENYYIVASRPFDEFIGWNQFEEMHSNPLSKSQALSLVNKIEYDDKVKKKFYEKLNEYLYDKYKTFASNPLLLTIMLLTYENGMYMPDRLNDFFEQAFITLFHAHDATKGGYKRDIKSKLGYENFKTVFSYFCFKSFFNFDYEFSEDRFLRYITMVQEKKIIHEKFDASNYLRDLTNSVCMLIHEGLEFKFSHRSFQEYFAALYTAQLDDLQQKRLLKLWLQDNSYRMSNNYLNMLYELQPNRFVQNVISPAIKELEFLFKKNCESPEWLINTIYDEVCVRNYRDGIKRCAVSIKNFYYHEMVERACKIGGLYKNIEEERLHRGDNTIGGLLDIIEEEYGINIYVKFDELKKRGYTKKLEMSLNWVIERYKFAVEFVDNNRGTLTNKNALSAILDEL